MQSWRLPDYEFPQYGFLPISLNEAAAAPYRFFPRRAEPGEAGAPRTLLPERPLLNFFSFLPRWDSSSTQTLRPTPLPENASKHLHRDPLPNPAHAEPRCIRP